MTRDEALDMAIQELQQKVLVLKQHRHLIDEYEQAIDALGPGTAHRCKLFFPAPDRFEIRCLFCGQIIVAYPENEVFEIAGQCEPEVLP